MRQVIDDCFQFVKPPKVKKTYRWNSTIPATKRKRRAVGHPAVKFKYPKDLGVKSYPKLVKELDAMISALVLKRANYTCVRCGKHYSPNKNGKYIGLTCSHYWDRQYKSVRFELDNLDALCWMPCHKQKWEHDKQGEYRDYMLRKLGNEGYDRLEVKARSFTKFSRVDIILMIDNFDKIFNPDGQ